ncbi:hypothetical protein [Sorangium sp. So ce341]|uniref:hypothetical protein n=1 Tax=Sorangium sp. So ce341 TaxID=3133302 RepID=UPI003F6223D6
MAFLAFLAAWRFEVLRFLGDFDPFVALEDRLDWAANAEVCAVRYIRTLAAALERGDAERAPRSPNPGVSQRIAVMPVRTAWSGTAEGPRGTSGGTGL